MSPKHKSSSPPKNLSLPQPLKHKSSLNSKHKSSLPSPKKDYHNTHKEPLYSFSQGWTQTMVQWQYYTGYLLSEKHIIADCFPPKLFECWSSAERGKRMTPISQILCLLIYDVLFLLGKTRKTMRQHAAHVQHSFSACKFVENHERTSSNPRAQHEI